MNGGTNVRIGVAFPGDPTDRAQWSGTPYGVVSGLRAAGVDVVPVDVEPPRPLREALGGVFGLPYLRRAGGTTPVDRLQRAYSTGIISPGLNRVRGRIAGRRLRDLPLDGIIQIGTGFVLPTDVPFVTYEDMTVPQALDYPYTHWSALRERDVSERIAVQRAAYTAARAVCMTNSWAGESAVADFGVDGRRVHSVGVGSHEPHRAPERDWGTPRLLYVGVDWERKNGPAVLRCFRRLREEHPTAELDVVGIHPRLDEPGVRGHGFLRRDVASERDRLRSLFDGSTCFVMPSLFEPSAVVYTEALAAALPSIGTAIGGSADLIGDAGFVVDPHSDLEILEAMRAMTRPDRAAELSRRAYERAPLFTWQAVAERLLRAVDPGILGRPLTAFL